MFCNYTFSIYTNFSIGYQRLNALSWNDTYPKGVVVRLGDFDVYSVGPSTSDAAIVVLYDINGFNTSQTRVFCDRLASNYSIQVVMPDVFRGTARPATGDFGPWLSTVNNWTRISADLTNVANWLRNSYSKKYIGLTGFCWGGLQVVRACSNLSNLFTTGISIHGSSLSPSEVRQINKPMLFIAAVNDAALHPNISDAIAEAKPQLSQQCEYKTYNDSRHGFVAGGANYSNPENVRAIDDVHLTVNNYLNKTLRNMSISLEQNLSFLIFFIIFSFYLY